MNAEQNSRQYPRRTSYIIAEYSVLEGRFRDIIKSIGAGGLFIKTYRKVAVGQPVLIKFPLFNFDQTVETTGRVVRRDPDGISDLQRSNWRTDMQRRSFPGNFP